MIFVTGGTGLVGSYLLVELAKGDQPIRALKRKKSNTKSVEQLFSDKNLSHLYKNIQWVDGDLLDVTELPNLLKNVSSIYHTAAFVSFDKKDENEIFNTNISGTEALVNEAIDSQVKEFFFISSIAAMDDLNPVTKKINELSPWNNALEHSAYAISKFRAEMEVWRASQEGLNVIIVNPGVIIGSLDGKRESEKLFAQDSFINKYAPTGGTGFVDVRDVVTILLDLVEKKIYNQKFILVSENKYYKEVLDLVASKNNKQVKLLSNSFLKVLRILSNVNRLFGGVYISKSNYNSLTSFIQYDNTKIKETLNYNFIPVNVAIDYHYSNYKKYNSLK